MSNETPKHAYLILAHNQFTLLKMLLQAIDDLRNDIFLHIDRKASFDPQDIRAVVKKSRLFFTERIPVYWGDESQIQATLQLLKTSTETAHYVYYHLISGQDFPLASQDTIHAFFDAHQGQEFISCSPVNEMDMRRIRYYYPFQRCFGRHTRLNFAANRILIAAERILRIDRAHSGYRTYGIGANWFSITDRMARYVLTQQADIQKHFYCGFCADEVFLQTLWLNAPFYDEKIHYRAHINHHPNIGQIYLDVLRAIDWTRGRPYTYDARDFEMLKSSGCFFARKLSEEKSMQLAQMLMKSIAGSP